MKLFTILLLLITVQFISAQTEPAGKFSGLMYLDYFYNASRDTGFSGIPNRALSGAKDLNGFDFRRIYLTYDYKISEDFSSKFRVESETSTLTSNNKLSVFIKDAFLKWKNIFSGSDLIAGIQSSPTFEVSEAVWGFRSVEKTIHDLRGIVASRDFGIALKGKLTEGGSLNYTVMFANNSNIGPETNKYKRIYGQVYLKPINMVHVTLTGDIRFNPAIDDPNSTLTPRETINNNGITTSLFAGYGDLKSFGFGVEGFMYTLQNAVHTANLSGSTDVENRNTIGVSVFGWYGFTPSISAFARFDYFDPVSNSHFEDDARNFIALGMSFKPHEKVAIIPNVLIETYDSFPSPINRSFTASVTPRITFYYEY